MATTPTDPKKPTTPPQQPGAKPPTPQAGAKPNGTAKPGAPAPGAKPGQPPAKPNGAAPQAGAKPGQTPPKPGGSPPAPKKPTPTRNKFALIDTNTRQLGQKLVDLGYLDDMQLESIYEEMLAGEQKLPELVLARGLATDDQILQATAEVHGMKVVNLEDTRPSPEALKVVPKNMAELYKMVPISFEADTLTVAMSDPNNLQALDDIRNFLGIRQVVAVLAPQSAVEGLMQKAYNAAPGAEESIAAIIAGLEADPELGKKVKRETSIDLD